MNSSFNNLFKEEKNKKSSETQANIKEKNKDLKSKDVAKKNTKESEKHISLIHNEPKLSATDHKKDNKETNNHLISKKGSPTNKGNKASNKRKFDNRMNMKFKA